MSLLESRFYELGRALLNWPVRLWLAQHAVGPIEYDSDQPLSRGPGAWTEVQCSTSHCRRGVGNLVSVIP